MTHYSDDEMKAREARLGGIRTMEQWMQLQPKYPARDYTRLNAGGKLMQAKYAGTCVDCGGRFNVGDDIRFDGKAHHAGQNTCDRVREQRAKEQQAEPARARIQLPAAPKVEDKSLPDGKWTLQFADGHYRTFRIRTQAADATFAPGERVVAYLAAADNDDERSYRGFAFLKPGRLVVWSKFHSDSALVQDAQILLDVERAASAGEAYALASGNCYRCGHTLTVPASLHRGLGPECARKLDA